MCINGKCQHVGCDLRIGSRKTVDACGVCGGDGSSCATPLYHWDTVPSSLCSEACGGGYRSASHVCKNRVTGLEVEDALCDQTRRPEGEVEPCNTHRCPAKWIAEAWEMCSVSCGGGVRHRDVYCAEVISGNLTKVSDDMCYGTAKPRHKEPCASEKCPTWDSGEWSECSASCGMGIQTRPLACVDSYGSSLDDTACDPLRQPPLTRTCAAPSPCPQHAYNSLLPTSESGEDDQDSFDPDLDSDTDSDYTDPLLRPYPPMPAIAERLVGGANTDRAFLPGPWSPCSATCGEGWQHREVHCRVYLEGTKARARIDDRECPGPKPPDKQTCSGPPCISTMTKRFVVGEWGPCSVTCGEGVQHREVYCRLFLELSRGTTTLKQDQCPGMKPPESRSCTVSLCPLANTLDSRQDHPMADTAESPRIGGRKGTFSWKELGFGECSKSCLGGVQESIIQCVRDDDGKPAAPYQCRHEPKPEQRTRTCNDQPCPPRWNVTDWSTCSDECGMGIKIRDVTCLHEVTNTNLVPVPNNRCPAPPPPDRSYCNVLDCQPAWNASEWSKCSRPCGGGTKTRHVTCTQRMAQNHVVSRPASMCPAHAKPVERKPCNPKACSPDDARPRIEANDELHVTDSKPTQKQMSVKIGGSVHIFLGTRLKIRCPVKRFNRPQHLDDDDDGEGGDGYFLLTLERGGGGAGGSPWGSPWGDAHTGRHRRFLWWGKATTPPPPTASANDTVVYDDEESDLSGTAGSAGTEEGSRIVWQKDGKVLHPSRKYHISNKGVLKVVDASMHDGGRYSCVAGHSSADLTVVVKNIPGKFPNSEEVGGGQTPQQDPTYRDRHADTGRVFPGAGDDISHEVPPTGTSRFDTRRKQTPSPDKKYSYPRPDGNSVQGNNVYNNYNGHVSRPPYRNEYPSTPDDEDDEDDDGDPEDGSTAYPDATASSSATRSAPPLHGLVRHFQSVVAFSFIRQVLSDRLSTLPPLLSRLDQRPAPADSPPAADAAVAADQDAATTTEAAVGAGVLLGKGSAAAAELKFEWVITPWSDCSETCGGNGFQLRGAQCTVRRSGNATRGAAGTPGPATESVDAALCDDAGLPPPSTFQRCGSDECPRWSAGEWSTCEDSRCFAWNTAMQRRDVECKLPNDTLVDPLLCDEAEKPPVRLECYNDRCKGTWRVGEWSECGARCDGQGVKHRILQCVWFGTKKAAGNACREQPRPVVMKSCKGLPCAQGGECRDESQYCATVRAMNLCRLQRYQTQCCQSCRSNRG
ncbi:protein madd-4-like [Thrips palmi]|uniref:Protein madd-4-like n=1 Tax=Thrips palmi TaxID=161013 RepID=A0A6P8YT84_THRPL|nr:protein madd-4-like [Thrips palmi]